MLAVLNQCACVQAVLRSTAVSDANKCRLRILGLTPRGHCIQFTVASKLRDYGAYPACVLAVIRT